MVAAVKKRAACTLLTLGQVLPLEEIIRCRVLREGAKIDVAVGDTTAYAVWVAGEKAVVPSRIAMRLTDAGRWATGRVR